MRLILLFAQLGLLVCHSFAQESPFEIHVQTSPFIVREDDRQMQTASVTLDGIQDKAPAVITIDTGDTVATHVVDVAPDVDNRFDVTFPLLREPRDVLFTARHQGAEITATVTIKPPRLWTIFFVEHTHTDIGYTKLQTELMRLHGEYIVQALDICRQTDDYPNDAKFRWTCETTWTVQRFLEQCTKEQLEEFIRRVEEGRIEVAGFYLNQTDLVAGDELVRELYWAGRLRRDYGIPVVAAMNSDINGLSWAWPQLLSKSGIRYLNMATNATRAKNHRDRPDGFYWEAPDGSRVLTWNGEHYMHGNRLQLPKSMDRFVAETAKYLMHLDERGYPYNGALVQISGEYTDNSPPTIIVSDRVKEWNERFVSPRLVVATLSEWFEYLEANYRDEIPVVKEAWPDWWSDGHGSSAAETALNRSTHRTIHVAECVRTLTSLLPSEQPYPADELRRAMESMMLYDEHTWGAAQSISEPESEMTKGQWAIKSSYATVAHATSTALLNEGLDTFAAQVGDTPDDKRIVVFNSLSWKRSAPVELELDLSDSQIVVDDETGAQVPSQRVVSDDEESTILFIARDVPGLGYRTYSIQSSSNTENSPDVFSLSGNIVENKRFRVEIDPHKVCVTSVFDKNLQKELADGSGRWGFNQYIYEDALQTRVEMERPVGEEAFLRTTATNGRIQAVETGPVRLTVELSASANGVNSLNQDIRLYAGLPYIEFVNTIDKIETTEPEAVYFAFPFSLPEFDVRCEISDAVMTPNKQIEHSCRDWYCIQNWVAFTNSDRTIVWQTSDAPLVQLSQINTFRWADHLEMKHPAVFSYALNNYWTTNFKASQGGKMTFRYAVTAYDGPLDSAQATQFAWNGSHPLVAEVSSGGAGKLPDGAVSFVEVDSDHVAVLDFKNADDGRGVIVRLFESGGRADDVNVVFHEDFGFSRAFVTNPIEENEGILPLSESAVSLNLQPWEIKTIRLMP